jgi:hypothetical protein
MHRRDRRDDGTRFSAPRITQRLGKVRVGRRDPSNTQNHATMATPMKSLNYVTSHNFRAQPNGPYTIGSYVTWLRGGIGEGMQRTNPQITNMLIHDFQNARANQTIAYEDNPGIQYRVANVNQSAIKSLIVALEYIVELPNQNTYRPFIANRLLPLLRDLIRRYVRRNQRNRRGVNRYAPG